jgi:hypothetical protein
MLLSWTRDSQPIPWKTHLSLFHFLLESAKSPLNGQSIVLVQNVQDMKEELL